MGIKVKEIAYKILLVCGVLFLALNFLLPIMIDCRSITIASTQSSDMKYIASIDSQTCDSTERSGVFLSITPVDENTSYEVKISTNTSSDLDLNWVATDKIQVIHPSNLSLTNRDGELGGVRYEFQSR